MSKVSDFFTNNLTIVIPHGSMDEPIHGISELLSKLIGIKVHGYKSSYEFQSEIESRGIVIDTNSTAEKTYISTHYPVAEKEAAHDLLFKVFNESIFDNEDIEKAKATQLAELKELTTEDLYYTLAHFKEEYMGIPIEYGTEESLQEITNKDLKALYKKWQENYFTLEISSSTNYEFNETNYTPLEIESLKLKDFTKVKNLPRDFEQKVVAIGMPTTSAIEYSPNLKSVAKAILKMGLYGLVVEKIREENSAAYYALGGTLHTKRSGAFYIIAGTSEDRIKLVVDTAKEIIELIRSGNYEDKRVELAKQYVIGDTKRQFESLSEISGYRINQKWLNQEQLNLKQKLEEVRSITKKDLTDFYNKILNPKNLGVMINGDITDETLDLLKTEFK